MRNQWSISKDDKCVYITRIMAARKQANVVDVTANNDEGNLRMNESCMDPSHPAI